MSSIKLLGIRFDVIDNDDFPNKVHDFLRLENDQGLIFMGCFNAKSMC